VRKHQEAGFDKTQAKGVTETMRGAWRLLGERLDLLANQPTNVVMLHAA